MSAEIVTFGCRLNAYESEAMRARAAEAGLEGAIIFNTCAVTGEAVRQSRQAIRKARRANPGAKIIVTGCAAQTDPAAYAQMPEVDLVLGNIEKLETGSYAFGLDGAERVRVNDIMSVKETAAQFVDSFEGRTRAFLQVQNGCDHRCTFCIIPYGRGNSRSVPVGAVISEARRLAAAGFAELVLTGVDLTAYGADLPGAPTLGQLVQKILKLVPELKRLRLSSIDSIEADDTLMRAIAEEERLMPHFHLSVQAGDDLILKRMKRRHSRRDTIEFCETVRGLRPEAAFGADLIAAFPTETEDMHQNSLALVDEAGLTYLHVFPFSPRQGTPAARMPQLSRQTVKSRAAALRAKGDSARATFFAALAGSEQTLLVEDNGLGRTPCFAPVRFAGAAEAGSFVRVRITGVAGDHLSGEILS
ncbi:MAG: tRNA (N(6)-L-threonylcarbamoyladenosine(37)-C(2))-methylthiotransferase MtaB [Alphaproteobacteria bacterium]|nr:tRNA (N(6)-L-threonylcarbamoyladenosine(37)-C(2))-methylthiotransferase MtaB [Alphaproteobacteria bacterium]MBU6471683.1 tRNA (N(6)-L-threonylcarbamoyladenosine(37)-C(2))-methylthiotransferase MtaB [Alphaproteobacteria bacterium]MDE2072167.1 tRNA (N(6)-L-threonylcarbamoyladenosine(37)-C(2))-methylthiotransferase MtaB [Alphaproteobacteria bacterium]